MSIAICRIWIDSRREPGWMWWVNALQASSGTGRCERVRDESGCLTMVRQIDMMHL